MGKSTEHEHDRATPDFLYRMGLTTDCSLAEISQAYHRRARCSHPDHGGSKEEFQLLCDDYEKAKRYIEGPHKLKPPILGSANSEATNPSLAKLATAAAAQRNWLDSEILPIVIGTFLSGLVAFLGFSRLPIGLTVVAALGFVGGLVSIAVIGLPKIPKHIAVIASVTVWILLTGFMLFIAPEIKAVLSNPNDPQVATLPLLAIFSYVLVTFLGSLGLLVALTSKR